MNASTSRQAIRTAARHLFSERGYAATTIRDIAAKADVSPALVIKLHGSKAELYTEVGPGGLKLSELDVPRANLGRALVLYVLNRRRHGDPEPWTTLTCRLRDAPNAPKKPELRRQSVEATAALIGDTTNGRRHASAVICHMIGLSEGLRIVGLFPPDEVDDEEIVATFAPVLQSHIDACGPI